MHPGLYIIQCLPLTLPLHQLGHCRNFPKPEWKRYSYVGFVVSDPWPVNNTRYDNRGKWHSVKSVSSHSKVHWASRESETSPKFKAPRVQVRIYKVCTLYHDSTIVPYTPLPLHSPPSTLPFLHTTIPTPLHSGVTAGRGQKGNMPRLLWNILSDAPILTSQVPLSYIAGVPLTYIAGAPL